MLQLRVMENFFRNIFEEDELTKDLGYVNSLSREEVICTLKFKEPLFVSGIEFFIGAFDYLNPHSISQSDKKKLRQLEKKTFSSPFEVEFMADFATALTAERIALNLLQRSSAISTQTSNYVNKVREVTHEIKLLDTRKTTPGLRMLEKYATSAAGASNHRLGVIDAFMIKDNHKKCLGGLKGAYDFFQSQGHFYRPLIVEIHDLKELSNAFELNIKHMMLDNFSPTQITQALEMRRNHEKTQVSFEVSGGITLENIHSYCIAGVDAISVGSLTTNVRNRDISLKMKRKE